ncbi:MFS transporter [Candidatus Saccharibacteria bacterium]|nr:MFS transporter [Candidatus Saccharibacteria bacterium]
MASKGKSKWLVVIILACAQFIMVLDSTVMNVSISQVVKDLNTSVSGLQAAITFYTLTMAALMLTGGKMGDIWGRLNAFKIGAVIYGIGSLITALSPNLATLMIGWSLVEGLGAVLVIPAIAALIAMNYQGKDRVLGYTLIGAASGIAVAAGPLIGGYVTTYLSWRYVFAAETVIMAVVLMFSGSIIEKRQKGPKTSIDIRSVLLSASGMGLLVFGILQSKTWGWITPQALPEINGKEIAPLGISLVAYLILFGVVILRSFYLRQKELEAAKANPLLRVSMFSIKVLRSGLAVLSAQYIITSAVFFVMPIYLQMVLGLDALETGMKIFPLSVSIVIFSMVGSKLITRYSPKQIVRAGQLALVGGSLLVLGAIDPELKGILFALGMLVLGAGLGLLASQIGNVTMSSVSEDKTSEVGGLQGTFQNFGASLGTALIGSIMIANLTAGFITNINQNPELPDNLKTSISDKAQAGVPIVSSPEVEQYALNAGLSTNEADAITSSYESSQLKSLKHAMFFVVILGLAAIALSRNIPSKKLT